jgi:hypothetical protein
VRSLFVSLAGGPWQEDPPEEGHEDALYVPTGYEYAGGVKIPEVKEYSMFSSGPPGNGAPLAPPPTSVGRSLRVVNRGPAPVLLREVSWGAGGRGRLGADPPSGSSTVSVPQD